MVEGNGGGGGIGRDGVEAVTVARAVVGAEGGGGRDIGAIAGGAGAGAIAGGAGAGAIAGGAGAGASVIATGAGPKGGTVDWAVDEIARGGGGMAE